MNDFHRESKRIESVDSDRRDGQDCKKLIKNLLN